MPIIVNARLKASERQQTFETDNPDIKRSDKIVVDSELGMDIAIVLNTESVADKPERPFSRVIRIATDEDVKQLENNTSLEEEGRRFCQERIKANTLPMHLVGTRITLDKKKFIFYFTAEKRVDFRELVKELASKFSTRIELRQIGIRDEAKILGGIGSCGREVCCKLFLTRFAPISIRMAKKQDIALNPSKLSGLCGRLMCCLSYEHVREKKIGGKDKPARTRPPKPEKSLPEEPAPKATGNVQATEKTSGGKPVQDSKKKPESTETSGEKTAQKQKQTQQKPPRRRRRPRKKKDKN